MQVFKTIRAAAIDALRKIAPRSQSEQVEYGGLILKTADGFVATEPKTDNSSYSIDLFPERWGINPLSAAIVSAYHTHPTMPENYAPDVFSDQDMESGIMQGFSSWYMAQAESGVIYEGTPETPAIKVCNPVFPDECALGGKGTPVGRV